jgi:hypothetical protein
MSTDELRAKLLYCQSMAHLAEHQIVEWRNILSHLDSLVRDVPQSTRTDVPRQVGGDTLPHGPPPERNEPVAPERAARDRQNDERARAQMGMRMGHLIRGLVLIYALSLPRMFYYVFAGYSLLLLSGLLDNLQRLPFRRLFAGTRPSLELQLSRLRQRQEYIERLRVSESMPIDADEKEKICEFLSKFEDHKTPFWHRVVYQSVVMFFYSAFPACHPHSEYLT